MSNYKPINGYTKEKIIEVINRDFKGKSFKNSDKSDSGIECLYLSENGKKCAVGLFIPDGHPAQESTFNASDILFMYKDLINLMPLDIGIASFQTCHDFLDEKLSIDEQKQVLIKWVKENIV